MHVVILLSKRNYMFLENFVHKLFNILVVLLPIIILCVKGQSIGVNRVDFFYSNEKMTWENGKTWCVNNGGIFASVHSDFESGVIQGIHPMSSGNEEHLHLGAYWDSVWKWVDGTNFDYQWSTTDGLTGVTDSIIAQKKDGDRDWRVHDKSVQHQVLCQRLPRVEYFVGWEGTYYFRARDRCNELGGELASLHTIQDYLKIKHLRQQVDVGIKLPSTAYEVTEGSTWLGLVSKRSFKGKWEWEDGTSLDWWPHNEHLTTTQRDFSQWDSDINVGNGDQIHGIYKNDQIQEFKNYDKTSITGGGMVSPSVACQRVTTNLPSPPKLEEMNIKFDVINNNMELTINPTWYKAEFIKVRLIKTFPAPGVTYQHEPPIMHHTAETNYFDYQHSNLNAIQLCAKQCTRLSEIRKPAAGEMNAFFVKDEDYTTTTAEKGACKCVTYYDTTGSETNTGTGTGFFKQTYEDTTIESIPHTFTSLNFDELITPIQIFACNSKGCSAPTEMIVHCEIPRTTANGITAEVTIKHDCLTVAKASDGAAPYQAYAEADVYGTLHVTGTRSMENNFPSILGYGNTGRIFTVKSGGTLYLKNIKLKNGNKIGPCEKGGALKANSGSTVHITNVIFDGNYAYRGSAILATGSQLNLKNVNFTNNVIKNFSGGESTGGGIIRVESSSTLDYVDGTVANNTAVSAAINSNEGAGISCYKSTCILKNLLIQNNVANQGSSINQKGGTLIVENSILEDNGNDALTDSGGAIYLDGKDYDGTFPGFNATIKSGTIIRGNKAKSDTGKGGGIYTSANGNLILDDVTIEDNTAFTADYIYTHKDGTNEPNLNFINVNFGNSGSPFAGSCTGVICNVKNCAAIGSTHCHTNYGFPDSKCIDQSTAEHGVLCQTLPVPSSISITIKNNDEVSLRIEESEAIGAVAADTYEVTVTNPVNGSTTTSSYSTHGTYSISTPKVYSNTHIKVDMSTIIYKIEVSACTASSDCGEKLIITTKCYPPRSCTGCERTCTIQGQEKEEIINFATYTRV